MRNIKLVLEYDGTNYVGWQQQENGRSIQGEIKSVLEQILREHINLVGAGRTDAGVHARGQVANFRTESELEIGQIKGGLNGLLADDIVVRSVEEVPPDFHARYSAKKRVYIYQISFTPSALERHFYWHVKYSLDVDTMQRAARHIVGTHDFESFCKAETETNHYRCNVTLSTWTLNETKLNYEIHADRFLHGMVRSLVGTIVDVGRGYTTLQEFEDICGTKNRREAGMAAPARGLVLERVIY
jgi:tRNA pseudouridine38-40 synthase